MPSSDDLTCPLDPIKMPQLNAIATLRAFTKGFANWPVCLPNVILGPYLHLRKRPISFVSKKGHAIVVQGHDIAWWSVLENLSLDGYHLGKIPPDEAPRTFLDIGANLGAFSISLLERFPDAVGQAYEPVATTFSQLEANIARNKMESSLECFRAAVVGTELAEIEMYSTYDDSATSTILPEISGLEYLRAGRKLRGEWNTVPAKSFSEIVLNFADRVDLVKVDIEGGEFSIVENTNSETWKRVRSVVIEYHPVHTKTAGDIVRLLESNGLQLRRHEVPSESTRGMQGTGILWFARPDMLWLSTTRL